MMTTLISLSLVLTVWLLIHFFRRWKPGGERLYLQKKMLIFGHRGYPLLAPENTLDSVKRAFEHGADGVEVDLMTTRDLKIVIHHDFNFKNPDGTTIPINQVEYSRLISLSGEKSKGRRIPTLNEMLDSLPHDGIINLEIKTRRKFSSGFEEQLVKIIHDMDMAARVIVSSFNPLVIRRVKRLSPQILTAFLWEKNRHFPYFDHPVALSFLARADAFHPRISSITRKLVDRCRRRGLKINVWTVNTKTQLQKARRLEVDGIMTDDIQFILENL